MGKILKGGHRGARGYCYDENSINSLTKGVELGADVLEFDLRSAVDGIVVIHDAKVDKTTNGAGLVRKYTLFDLAHLTPPVPSFNNVLAVFGKGNMFGKEILLNAELKEKDIAQMVLESIRVYNMTDCVIVSAFDDPENSADSSARWSDLFWMYDEEKAKKRDLKIALLVRTSVNFRRALALAAAYPLYSLNLRRNLVTDETVQAVHGAGCKVFVWTVNDRQEIADLKALGVDGIFSDYPDLL